MSTMRLLSVVFLVMLCYPLFGQAPTQAMRANNILYRYSQMQTGMNSGDVLQSMPSTEVPEVIGDIYWDMRWSKSSILLYKKDELVEGHLTRYDMHRNEFEFKFQNDVKVLKGSFVKNVVWLDSITESPRYLVNGRDYLEDGVPITGFIEVLVEGQNGLFKKMTIEILKPDYNPALAVGSKDYRIIKKGFYYFNIDENLFRIKSKKDIEPLQKEGDASIATFIKKEGIKFNQENDLIKLFTFIGGQNRAK